MTWMLLEMFYVFDLIYTSKQLYGTSFKNWSLMTTTEKKACRCGNCLKCRRKWVVQAGVEPRLPWFLNVCTIRKDATEQERRSYKSTYSGVLLYYAECRIASMDLWAHEEYSSCKGIGLVLYSFASLLCAFQRVSAVFLVTLSLVCFTRPRYGWRSALLPSLAKTQSGL